MAVKQLNTDCLDFMKGISDKSFDLGSADPPYFKGVGKMGYFGRVNSSIGVKRGKYEVPTWDNFLPTKQWFDEFKRCSVNQIVWGANYFDFIGPVHPTPRRNDLQTWINEHPSGWIVWDKLNGNTAFNDFELAWTSFDFPTEVFTFLWSGMIQGVSLQHPTMMQGNKKLNQKRIHPTQKPKQLYEWQFKKFVKPGQSILETHLGSGSAAIVAEKLGLDMVATEINETAFNAAVRRFNKETDLGLFKV